MAFYVNPVKRFKDSIVLTKPPYDGRHPKNTREAVFIHRANSNGIFQIEKDGKYKLYDRCYIFSDINYINKNDDEKATVLINLMEFLKSMSASFKITVANEYQDMSKYINYIFNDMNGNQYPVISEGIRSWIDEKKESSNLHDLNRVLYLTITVRSHSYDDARSYFLAMDSELDVIFKAMGSFIAPIDGTQRLNCLRNFFYHESKSDYNFVDDVLYDVIPVSAEAGYRDFMLFNKNTYVSVLFAREYDSSLNEGKLIHTLAGTSYQYFVTVDYAPVEHSVTKNMLKSTYGNNERAISQEADLKKSNNQSATGISYSKKKKRAELEEYIDKLDDESEECLQAGLLVVVTAESEEELALRIEEMQRKGKSVGVTLDTYNYVQLKAFNTALPTGVRMVKKMRSFYTGSLVAMQPFFSPDIMDKGGIFYGINSTTKNFVFADRKKLPSPHGMIVGHTGTGKSYLIKETEIAQTLLSTDDDIQMIDPQNESEVVCAKYGGRFLDLTPRGDIHINPMEVPYEIWKSDNKKDKDSFVAGVASWADSFCEAVMYNILFTQEHRNFIDKAVGNIYEKVFASKKLLQPTLRDLRNELIRLENESGNEIDKRQIHMIVNSLEQYTEGIYDMFAYPSDIDISRERFVSFGLKNVGEDYWLPVMITIMFFLSNRMEYNQDLRRATRLIVDEAQVVMSNISSGKILLNTILTYRKYGGIVTMALQNLTRAVENPDLRDMLSNCGYKMFFDQGGSDAIALSKIQELTDTEYRALSDDRPGKSVMVWGKKVILLDSLMSKDNPLYEHFSTNFHEKAEKERLNHNAEGTAYGG